VQPMKRDRLPPYWHGSEFVVNHGCRKLSTGSKRTVRRNSTTSTKRENPGNGLGKEMKSGDKAHPLAEWAWRKSLENTRGGRSNEARNAGVGAQDQGTQGRYRKKPLNREHSGAIDHGEIASQRGSLSLTDSGGKTKKMSSSVGVGIEVGVKGSPRSGSLRPQYSSNNGIIRAGWQPGAGSSEKN